MENLSCINKEIKRLCKIRDELSKKELERITSYIKSLEWARNCDGFLIIKDGCMIAGIPKYEIEIFSYNDLVLKELTEKDSYDYKSFFLLEDVKHNIYENISFSYQSMRRSFSITCYNTNTFLDFLKKKQI